MLRAEDNQFLTESGTGTVWGFDSGAALIRSSLGVSVRALTAAPPAGQETAGS